MKSIFIVIQFGFCISLIQAADLFNSDSCGSEKLCERRPANCQNAEDCNLFFSSRSLNANQVEIELWAPAKLENGNNLNYLAVGFSTDTKMGDDYVSFCYRLDNGETGIGTGKTVGKSFTASTDQNSDLVELKEVKEEDNQFYCNIVQTVNNGSTDLLKPDLTKEYHILVVRGSTSDGKVLNIHEFGAIDGPFVSGSSHSLTSSSAISTGSEIPANSGASPTSNSNQTLHSSAEAVPLLIRFHGTLMLIAWLAFVFNAVYSARHLREHWPNTTVSGLQIWFHIHRLLNVLGVILIVISVILVAIHTDFNWTGPSASKPSTLNTSMISIHSLLGLLAVILAIFQPFMALMRCDKGDSKRPIFNVLHRSAGLLALLLSVITIGIALLSGEFQVRLGWTVPTAVPAIFIAFLIFLVTILTAQEIIRIREVKENQKITAIEMHSRNPAPSDNYYYKNRTIQSTRYRHITSVLFIAFVIVSVSVAVILAYFVFAASNSNN